MAEKLPEKTLDEQATDGSVFGAIQGYNANYNQILNEQDAYLVSRLEQQKQKAEQSYTQEKSAAYADYQKQVDPYGVQAEQLASSGLSNSGYAESLKTQAYVAYQNRQAVAHQSYQDALVSFNNAFNEAKMQNDATRANLAFQTYQMQLETIISMLASENAEIFKQASQIMQNAQGGSSKWIEEASKIENGEYYNAPTYSYTIPATTEGSSDNATYTYASVVSLMEQNGVSEKPVTYAGYARSPWLGGKYNTYEEYLKAFVEEHI